MAEVDKEITVKVKAEDDTQKATQSAKARLRDLQKQMLELEQAGKKNTDQFRRLASEAGSLKDAIGDTSAQVKALASDTRTLDTFTSAIQGIAGGFAVAQGAAALFGDENEDLQKAMVKVQGALALVNGATAVANALNKDSALMVNLNSVAQRAYALAVGTSTGALKAFRIALAATGVGAAVVAIGLLAANYEMLTAKVKGFLGIKVKENLDGQIQSMERLAEIAKARGATEAEVFAMEFDISRKRLQNAKNDEEMAEARHQHNLLRAQYESYQKKQELDKQDAAAKDADKKQQERDKAAEERRRKQQEQHDAEAAKQKEIDGIIADSRQVLLENSLSANERELEQIDQSYEERLAKVKGNEEATNLLLSQLRAERTAKIQEQQDAADQAELDEQKAQLDYQVQVQDEYYAATEAQRQEDLKKAQEAAELQKKIEAAKVQTAKSALQGIADLSSLFAGKSERSQRRAFEINKKMSMAQTLIETYSAAQGAYRSQMSIPDPSAPVRATIAAAAAVASGLLRLKEISKQTFQSPSAGGGGEAGGGGGEGGMAAPQGNAMNPNSQLLNPNTGQAVNPQPLRAYVVESDVSGIQNRLRTIRQFAQLGN